ncbi:hypothetical protein KUCAC02_002883, partial [Chaenocephalus aceratus]
QVSSRTPPNCRALTPGVRSSPYHLTTPAGGQQSELECLQTQLVLYRQKRTDNHEKQEVDGGGGSAAAVPLVPCIGPVMVAIQRAPSAPRAAYRRRLSAQEEISQQTPEPAKAEAKPKPKKAPAKTKKAKEVEKAKPEEKAPEAPAENGEAKAEEEAPATDAAEQKDEAAE